MISHHCFNFHFPDDILCGTSFQMLTHMPCVYLFREMSVKVFGPFSNHVTSPHNVKF